MKPDGQDHASTLRAIPSDLRTTPWRALGEAALQLHYSCYHRAEVQWYGPINRRSLLHWCCRSPMRAAWVRFHAQGFAAGWDIAPWRFVACGTCGRIRKVL